MNKQLYFARALIVVGALGFSVPALADTVCLRKAPDVSLVGGKAPSNVQAPSISAVVLSQEAASYAAKGFAVVDCPSVEKQAQFRESICAAADHGNSYLKALLARHFGDTPARLCASARAAVTLVIKVPPPGPTVRASASPPSAAPAQQASPQN